MTNDNNDRDQPYQYRRNGNARHDYPGRLALTLAIVALIGALAFAAYTAAEHVL